MQLTIPFAVNLLAWLVAMLAAGAWMLTGFIHPRTGEHRMSLSGREPLVQVGRWASLLGAALSAVMALTGDQPTAWWVATVASVLAFALSFMRRWETVIYTLALTALALVAPVAAREELVPRNQDVTTDASMVAVVAFSVVGGCWLLSATRPLDALASSRLRFVSTVGAVVVAICELATLWGQWSGSWETSASWHLVRLLCAVALGALAWLPHRTARIPGALLALVGQVAAVATQHVVPHAAGEQVATDVQAFGYSVAEWPTLVNLVTKVRINLFFFCLALVAIGAYLWFVHVLHRRGDRWPAGRTFAWVVAWLLLIVLTSSGLGRYAPAVFSVHMFVNLGVNMLCAMVLALGGFITLVLRATPARGRGSAAGLREWVVATMHSRYLGFLYNPIIALVFMTGTYYVYYLTGLFTSSLQMHWLHQFFYLHFLISGYIFYGLIIGIDQPPHPLPHIGKLGLIIGAMPFHAFFGVILMAKTTVYAESFLTTLGHPWMAARGLMHDQWVGGTIAWAGGEFPLVIALLALFYQWSKQDRKESSRIDRHMDAGTDESYDAYNQMLAQLAERDRQAEGRR
ncbi:cytochrome c oxidase assembly protein [Luteococcus peritonei]|uniref:Cytochrome c oxidase assembly protein n=1 Tax=Luteococcus peritonei TaxID=88874 RepID=A0ABW4RUQ2_9ACTN